MRAQDRLTASAPSPVSDSHTGSGGVGALSFVHAVQIVASAGTSRMPARAIPSRARFAALQPSATAIKMLTEASSRKSTLSANSDTEPCPLERRGRALRTPNQLRARPRLTLQPNDTVCQI